MTESRYGSKLLSISFERTCSCPASHINCLSAKEWMLHQIAVWEFYYTKRDIRNKKIHPAVFPISLATRCIELFTHRGELVMDPFVGSGTTLVAASDLERNAVGFDLKHEYVELANSRVPTTPESGSRQVAICDDSRNIPEYLREETVSLCLTSPPYASLLNRQRKNKSIRGDLRQDEHYMTVQQYSDDPRDLGTLGIDEYSSAIREVYSRLLPLLRPRAHALVNVTDYWWKGKRVPAHVHVIDALEKAGFELRNTIIWDRRNLVNKAGIYGWPSNYITLSTTFEYILDFWKPTV